MQLRDKWRWGSVVFALLVLFVAWLWPRRDAQLPVAEAAMAPAPAKAKAVKPAASSKGMGPWELAALAAKPEKGRDSIEVCGLGRAKVTRLAEMEYAIRGGDEPLPEPLGELRRQMQATRSAAIAGLAAGGDEYSRMLALTLQGDHANAVALAASTRDGRTYGLAVAACQRTPQTPASPTVCQQLNLQRWAELEPDNAEPWRRLAQEARVRGDLAQETVALEHAARATRVGEPFGKLTAAVLAHIPAQTSPLARMALTANLLYGGVGGEQRDSSSWMGGACEEPISDPDRRQHCRALAKLLMSKGDTLLDVMVGSALANRAQLPKAEIPITREEVEEVRMIEREALPFDVNFFSCASVQQWNEVQADVMRVGSWRAMRQRAERRRP